MPLHTNGYHEAIRVTWISMAINLLLGVGKLAAGVVGNSWAVIADGLHTLSDLLSSVAILIGLRVAERPPDPKHPYGHGKAEVLAARLVGFLLFAVGGFILHEATGKLYKGGVVPIPGFIALW
ncbi:MAG TPA: cation diffusion facilitator family transporter, partial [Planctomycetota bacterium]|nr:cation diffusion facilitator family transporter [Planctomycetota bacterium]